MSSPLVLIVDDTEASRYLHARILRGAGMNIAEAATGEQALQMVEQLKPDLVLLDIKLPDVNGLEVCQRIRTSSTHPHVAVLHISSTYVTPEIEIDSARSGADIYLAEPVDSRELISVTRALLRLKKAETALLRSEERLRLATAAAEIATWDIDLRTGEAVWDAQMRRLLFCPEHAADASWSVWRNRIHPEDLDAVAAAFEDARSGATFSKEHRLLGSSGEMRWVAPQGRVLNESGRPARMIGVLTDITERKLLDERKEEMMNVGRLALMEAENLARIKDQFLAMLGHELRTPMNVVMNWLHMLRHDDLPPSEHGRALEIVERNGRQMTSLLNDLLDVSGILSGKLVLQPVPSSIGKLLSSAVENIRPAASAKHISLDLAIDTVESLVAIDPVRLQQVFANLLSNAVKFTPAGGRIGVYCRQAQSGIEIGVTDTGQGIARDALAFIFDPFRQADGSITRRHGGLGLGLAIVRHIVDRHGGSVRVESAGQGQGATFTILLPAMPPSPATSDEDLRAPDSGVPLAGVRVLAVDDEADALEVLREMLQLEGAIVETATSAAQAMSKARASSPDVMILDLGMPDESGFELLPRLRAQLGRPVPAIALTGYARLEDAARSLHAGFQAHRSKPFNADELCKLIATLAKSPAPAD